MHCLASDGMAFPGEMSTPEGLSGKSLLIEIKTPCSWLRVSFESGLGYDAAMRRRPQPLNIVIS